MFVLFVSDVFWLCFFFQIQSCLALSPLSNIVSLKKNELAVNLSLGIYVTEEYEKKMPTLKICVN